jgi:hypothetical protein
MQPMSFPAIRPRSSPGSKKQRSAGYLAEAGLCLSAEVAFPRGYRASAA